MHLMIRCYYSIVFYSRVVSMSACRVTLSAAGRDFQFSIKDIFSPSALLPGTCYNTTIVVYQLPRNFRGTIYALD